MKILKELIEHANDTLDEVHEYVRQAYHIHQEHKALADTYIKIAETHISIFNMLHERMVALIEEEKRKGAQPPACLLYGIMNTANWLMSLLIAVLKLKTTKR